MASKEPLADLDDAALAVEAIKGDPRAHAVVWDRYAGVVRGILLRGMGTHKDVEDLVQEVLHRQYDYLNRHIDPLTLNRHIDLKPWLLRQVVALQGYANGIERE